METELRKIVLNRTLMRKLVYSVNAAVTVDIPREIRENRLETNNRIKLSYGDYINENLRNHVVDGEKVELISFTRYAWDGRILVDRENKVTYTICTELTLKAVARKHGTSPHYLKSILFVENHEYEGTPKQISLADVYPSFILYTQDDIEEDYDAIMQGKIDKLDGYTHYVIAYSVEKSSIRSIRLVLLDKDIAEVETVSLMEFIEPDFVALTQSDFNAETDVTEEEQPAEKSSLVKVRPGFKPSVRAMEDKA